MRRVTLVNPWSPSLSAFFYSQGMSTPPVGMCRAAAYLLEAGYEVAVLDGQVTQKAPEDLGAEVIATNPDIVCIVTVPETHLNTFMSVSAFPYHIRFAREIRHLLGAVPVILGGTYAGQARSRILESEGAIDFIFTGLPWEFPDFVSEVFSGSMSTPGASGSTHRRAHALQKDGSPSSDWLHPSLHLLEGYPDSYGIDQGLYLGSERNIAPVQPVLGAMGCPHSCSFCSTPLYFERRFLQRPVSCLVEEIRKRMVAFRVSRFSLWDDTFTTSPPRVKEFCETLLHDGPAIEWWCFGHTRFVNSHPELLDLMRRAGCTMMWLGIEATDERTLEAYNKRVTYAQGVQAVKYLVAADILPTTSIILGNVDDTDDDLKSTIDVSMRLMDLGTVNVYTLLIPIPGTPVFSMIQKEGRLASRDLRLYNGARNVIRHPHLDGERLEEVFYEAYANAILSDRFLRQAGRVNFKGLDSRETGAPDLRALYHNEVNRMLSLETTPYYRDSRPEEDLWLI